MPPGIEAMEMLGTKRDIAYLRFNEFSEEPGAAAAARSFLVEHANARAVIIDGRPLRGGGLRPIDAMLPLFFSHTTTLARLETRAAAAAKYPEPRSPALIPKTGSPDLELLDHVVRPDPREARLRSVPLICLVSRHTASAGEHLAFVLRRTGRGLLIGETTAGAGHFGGFESIGDRLTVFMPIGQTVDPKTGTGWEGTGVAADVQVPADVALATALARLGEPGSR
jgi:C-terminal processing protease CtpA/Prc